MRVFFVAKCFALGGALVAASLSAQTLSPAERFAHIKEIDAIDVDGLKPWHLKASFTVLDAAGKLQKSQTLEVWWRDSKNWRRVFTDGDSSPITLVSVDGKRYGTTASSSLPGSISMLMEQIVHPVSEVAPGSVFQVQRHEFGKVSADCVMASASPKAAKDAQLGLFPTYCVGDDDALRLRWFGPFTFVNNKGGKFQGHNVPLEISLSAPNTNTVQGKVDALGTVDPNSIDLSITGLVESRVAARVSSGVVAGLKLSGMPPDYPVSARQDRVSGTVVLKAIIGKDGHITQLDLISSPDQSLTSSAMTAVRTWIYRPYLLEGVPVEVDTTIMVNFNLHGTH